MDYTLAESPDNHLVDFYRLLPPLWFCRYHRGHFHSRLGDIVAVVAIWCFSASSRTYSNVLRFSSFVDIMRIFASLTAAYVSLIFLQPFVRRAFLTSDLHFPQYPFHVLYHQLLRHVLLSYPCENRFRHLEFRPLPAVRMCFIYGAKEAGVNIPKTLHCEPSHHYLLRGFIADEPELVNKVIMGVRVFANDDTLLDQLNSRGIQTVIVSPAKMDDLKNLTWLIVFFSSQHQAYYRLSVE